MERENRKVLISIKVSTLLLILISIIGIIVLSNILINKIQNNNIIANTNENKYEENLVIEKFEEEPQRVIKPVITSRGTVTEDKRENQDKIYGTVSGINIETVENSIEETIVEEIKTTPIEEVTISKDMDLTVRTGLSREDFIKLIAELKEDKSGFFEENAGLIYDLCEKYQINEIFFCGLIAGESGWNIANNHRRTHNYISLMASGGRLIKYTSVEDGLESAAKVLHTNYLTEGGRFYYGSTLAGVKTRFCPASSTWVNLIYGNMKKIIK